MKPSHIIIILILLSLGIITYWFYNNFERVSETVEIGYQGEARDNPLLAAERLLERMGTPTKTVQSLPDVEEELGRKDTLVVYSRFLSQEQIQQLVYWIEAGGHLIIGLYDAEVLFTAFGIEQYQNGLNEAEIAQAPPTEFFWAQYRLQVAFNPDYYLEYIYVPAAEINDEYGTHLLSYNYGSGRLTLLSDLAFIKNDKIGEYDHAQFLGQLVHLERTAAQVWLLRTQAEMSQEKDVEEMSQEKDVEELSPKLWALLWRNMWAVIISATMLLLFWLWLASRRFGSLLPAPPRARRRLLEHIEASGHFLWRQNQAAGLLHSARQALLKRLESAHPDWARLSDAQLSQRLAQQCELPADQIEIALYSGKADTEFAFTRTIQILTQIRKKL
ncbi:MAG: DUF4350 domain-containing protein [Pseudomonadota bacterium]